MIYRIYKLQIHLEKKHKIREHKVGEKEDGMKDNKLNQYFMFHILNLHTQCAESKNA